MTTAEPPADSLVGAVADAASVDTGNPARDRKVLSETFLDAAATRTSASAPSAHRPMPQVTGNGTGS
ncbi:YceI family protein [Streptomyces mirabilis]|uniref:YceI family protein n=1 Tax=Streptomyces mirabilis TaxID=68239 RepID=UPI0036D04C85